MTWPLPPLLLILIILDFMNRPRVGPEAACIHYVRKLVSQNPPWGALHLQVVGDELLALVGLEMIFLRLPPEVVVSVEESV